MRAFRWMVIVLNIFVLLAGYGGTGAQDATPASLAGVQPLSVTGDRAAAFETYVSDLLAKTGIPGVSVAVVQGGKVVSLNGFGVKNVGSSDPVTPDTLMMIGSVTKSMTSLLAATLVGDGKLSWETPVVSLLPDFAVADPALTKTLTVGDAFCMCTGLPQHDSEFVYNSSTLTPEMLIASVADFPLTAPLGEQFQYSNQMYAIGGYAATVAAGGTAGHLYDAYTAAIRERVLGPLGMDRSTFALADVLASSDYAGSHGPDLTGTYRPIALADEDSFVTSVAPAGALWSSAREMARYVQMELAGGVASDGTRLVSTANLQATWDQRVALGATNLPPDLAEMGQGYGRGWAVGAYRGQRLLTHSGATFGFSSEVALLPDADLGVVILANGANADALNYGIQFRLLELAFDQPPAIDGLITAFLAGTAQQYAALQPQLGTVDPAAVGANVGLYTNPALGEITIALREGKLILDAGELRSALVPLLDETGAVTAYLAADPPLAGTTTVTFASAGGNPVMALSDLSSGAQYAFTLADKASSQSATPSA